MGGGMYRFLRSPKWLFGHALVLVVVVTFVNLGFWQLRRLDEVRAHNAHVAERLAADEVPLGDALDRGLPYTRVATRGEYLPEGQVLTGPRGRSGTPGHHVLTPLRTPEGTVLVDRGWVPLEGNGLPPEALEAPSGEVAVSGLLVPAEQGDPGDGEYVRTIRPATVAERTGVSLVPGYLRLQDSEPVQEPGPLAHADPVLDEGNHLSYAVQWFLFTVVVLVGYPLLLWRTVRDRRREAEDAARDEPAVPTGV